MKVGTDAFERNKQSFRITFVMVRFWMGSQEVLSELLKNGNIENYPLESSLVEPTSENIASYEDPNSTKSKHNLKITVSLSIGA
eukprot:Awhi_evm1s5072